MRTEFVSQLAERFESALQRRGPDGVGLHHDADTLIVHRRLAILDLSDAGAQPLWNEDETVCVAVNGEIYNFIELRRELESKGHHFRSRSDSEVLVHLYEDKGIEGCCKAIEGMFAFVLWDSRTRDLYLVRDRLGIKPLALAEHSKGVTFGSTLRSVMADADVPRGLRDEALVAFLKWGFVPSPWSAVRAVRRVMPGTYLRIRSGQVVEEKRWWWDEPADLGSTDKEVRASIEQAVQSHLVSDVPVCTLLSAGIDSGLVTSLAARRSDGIEAWTVSHPGSAEDEYPEAARAAESFGVKLHEVRIGATGLTEEDFIGVIAGMDEPLGTSSLVGMHKLYRAIAPHRRVALSGDGGDELFGGYDWHNGMPSTPGWARTQPFRLCAPGLSRLSAMPGRVGVLGSVAAHVLRPEASVYLDKLRVTSDDELHSVGLDPDFEDPIENSAMIAWERFAGCGTLEQMLAVDRATALVDEMLAKVDTASMSYSVEARVPFLADPVVRTAKGLGAPRKRQGQVGKICLRDWYREYAPTDAASRPKTGFNSPLKEWLSQPFSQFLYDWAGKVIPAISRPMPQANPRLIFMSAILGAWQNHYCSL